MDQTATASVPVPLPTNLSAKKASVFIVDDDQFLLDTYALKFSKGGYDVTYAASGDVALKKLHEGFMPEIMLIDNIMPGITGLELIGDIRKENLVPNATIIMLTNQNAPSDIDVARSLKVDGYIVKAMAVPSEVLAEVEKIHKERSARVVSQ